MIFDLSEKELEFENPSSFVALECEEAWLSSLTLFLGNWLEAVKLNSFTGYTELWIKRKDLYPVLYFLKFFSLALAVQLTDLICQDFISFQKRFNLTYLLSSLSYGTKLSLNFHVTDSTFTKSVQSIYGCASWLERENWDMFGVYFYGHRNLWRLLSDYGFRGFPLRKDFPMSGFIESFYDSFKKKIIRKPIELSQEYRLFTLNINWVALELANLILVDDYTTVLH